MLSSCRVHATLPTSDVDRLRTWYEGVLGLTPLAVRPGAVLYETTPGSVFAISRGSVPSSGTHTQMAFTVADVRGRGGRARGSRRRLRVVRIPADGRRHRDDRAGSRGLVQGSGREPAGDPAVRRSGLRRKPRGWSVQAARAHRNRPGEPDAGRAWAPGGADCARRRPRRRPLLRRGRVSAILAARDARRRTGRSGPELSRAHRCAGRRWRRPSTPRACRARRAASGRTRSAVCR